MFRPVLITFNS